VPEGVAHGHLGSEDVGREEPLDQVVDAAIAVAS